MLLGFHAGDGTRLKAEGYSGHPMNIYVHRRPPTGSRPWLDAAGVTVEAEMMHRLAPNVEAGVVFAYRPDGQRQPLRASRCDHVGPTDHSRAP